MNIEQVATLITALVAVYAGILSTIIFVAQRRQSRPILKVDLALGLVMGEELDETPHLLFRLTNVGRCKVIIVDVGFDLTKDRQARFPTHPKLPAEVDEGLYKIIPIEGPSILEQVKCAWVLDATGRQWNVPSRRIRKLKRKPVIDQIYADKKHDLNKLYTR